MLFTDINGLCFVLDKKNLEAKIINSPDAKGKILVPRSVNYESEEYIITSIIEGSFKNNVTIKSIEFTDDSKLRMIEKDSFYSSSIKNIFLPSSLEELKEGWNRGAVNLFTVSISNKNPNFKYLDEDHKIIIGKSNLTQKDYDLLVFVNHDTYQISIPSTIKYINSYSLSYCQYLNSIEFSEDSQIVSIEKDTFYMSNIHSIYIPPSVKELKDGWCNETSHLNHIEISEKNSNFSFLDKEKKIVIGKTNYYLKNFDTLIFASRDIVNVIIPSFIKRICPFAFQKCMKLHSIKFNENSELNSIGKCSFESTYIQTITIPNSVEKIEEGAFSSCRGLSLVQINDESELKIIEKNAFKNSIISQFFIPSKMCYLNDGWNFNADCLENILISSKNKNFLYLDDKSIVIGKSDINSTNFDVIVFSCKYVKQIVVPPFIKYINSLAFYKCKHLNKIEFSDDSQLISIGKFAFSNTSINSFIIPRRVEHIGEGCFLLCKKLKRIDFSKNSSLKIIEKNLFNGSSLTEIKIPSNIIEIGDSSFQNCINLHKVEFEENSNLTSIGDYAFVYCVFYNISIPDKVKRIGRSAFANSLIESIEFSEKSQLFEIEEKTFQNSNLISIKIPPKVKKIGFCAFNRCQRLQTVDFYENSELMTIKKFAFTESSISRISIPSNLIKLEKGWCEITPNLNEISVIQPSLKSRFKCIDKKMIVFKSNEKSDVFDVLCFVVRDIKSIVIPSFIKTISSYCFALCKNLEEIQFNEDSELTTIEKYALHHSSIQRFTIPPKTEKIEKDWCNDVLNKIEVSHKNNRFL